MIALSGAVIHDGEIHALLPVGFGGEAGAGQIRHTLGHQSQNAVKIHDLIFDLDAPLVGNVPVSYTHLDVYKRQDIILI